MTLRAEFNNYKEEGMGEDQTEGHIGHEASHSLSPGTYKYFFVVNGERRSVGRSIVRCFLLLRYCSCDVAAVFGGWQGGERCSLRCGYQFSVFLPWLAVACAGPARPLR